MFQTLIVLLYFHKGHKKKKKEAAVFMIQEQLLRATLCYPAEHSFTSHEELFSILCATIHYKAINYCCLRS